MKKSNGKRQLMFLESVSAQGASTSEVAERLIKVLEQHVIKVVYNEEAQDEVHNKRN